MPTRVIHTDDLRNVVKNRRGLLQYNASLNKFELKDMKDLEEQLLAAVEDDNDIPERVVEFIESKLDLDEMSYTSVDGGPF